jgi:ferredoxin
MLVINPDECIDCGVCEPECPIEAIVPDTDPKGREWIDTNRLYAAQWPNITLKGEVPADADNWRSIRDKKHYLASSPSRAED